MMAGNEIMPMAMPTFGVNTPTGGTAGHVVDIDTTDDYLTALNLNENSRYAGRIWSDKSVFANDVKVNGVTIDNDSDFLHVFSAIGSSLKTSGKNQLPLDVVFILDTSYSMVDQASTNGDDLENQRLEKAADALNSAIKTLMEASDYNRVGLVEFNSTSYKTMDLGRYKPGSTGRYFTYTGQYAAKNQKIEINATALDGGKIYDYTYRLQPVKSAPPYYLYGMTNTQAGFNTGMKMLADVADNDTTIMVEGERLQRIPVVIMISDGQPTYYLDTSRWWEPNTIGYVGASDSYTYPGVGLLALANASYMKQAINRKYFGVNNSYGDTATNPDYVAKVYTFGLELQMIDQDSDRDLANIVINPGENLKESNDNDMASYVRTTWMNYHSSTSVELNTPNYYSMRHPTTVYDIDRTGNAVDDLNYADKYVAVESAGNLENAINSVLGEVLKTDPWVPVAGDNDIHETDALTYIDPIGKYMEVKKVKNLLLLGELYSITEDGDKILQGDGVIIQKYKINDADLNVLRWNPSYGVEPDNLTADMPGVYKLSDIEIYVKITGDYDDPAVGDNPIESDIGFDQALYVNIPANALPIWVASYSSINGDVTYTTTAATPLRLFYTVGMHEGVLDENGKVDLTQVDADYIDANKGDDNAKVYFYSNWYADKDYSGYVLYDGLSSGDTVMSFSPADDNRYYIFQKNLRLYGPVSIDEDAYRANPENFEAQVTANAYDDSITVNGQTINAVSVVKSDEWYYIVIDYYDANGLVQLAVPRKGSMFGSGIGSDEVGFGGYLNWVDTTGNNEPREYTEGSSAPTDGTGNPNWVIATKIGCVRTGNMSRNMQVKDPNMTDPNLDSDGNLKPGKIRKTASTYYLPTISSSTGADASSTVINNYMGNNGRLEVTDTQVLVTKTVQDLEEEYKDTLFQFTITLVNQSGSNVYQGMTVQAIRVIRHPDAATNKWRARADTVELLTNNQGLLRDVSGELVRVDIDGNRPDENVTDEQLESSYIYYVYVGDDNLTDSEFTHTVFTSNSGKNTLPDAITVEKAYLVPVNDYSADSDYSQTYSTFGSVVEFPVGKVEWDNAIGHEVELYYNGRTTYLTTPVDFDDSGVGTFSLKHGDGLLFNNLDSDVKYTVKEILKAGQIEDKWEFKDAKTNGGTEDTTLIKDETGSDWTYAVNGKTSSSPVTSEKHYFNRKVDENGQLNIEITVDAVTESLLTDEFTFTVTLTLPDVYDKVTDGDDLPNDFTYTGYVISGVDFNNKVTAPEEGKLHVEWKESKGHWVGTATVTLKHGQGINITELPYGTKYKVEEVVENDYYLKKSENTEGTITESVSGTEPTVPTARFVNEKLVELPGTGGAGTIGLWLPGVALMLCAAALMFLVGTRRRNNA
ncbi:MAG: VWA domain-containing protein [Christensenellaceae bacterium]|nr:VWA domain-containing protein [Christensenellaceae bacterium]